MAKWYHAGFVGVILYKKVSYDLGFPSDDDLRLATCSPTPCSGYTAMSFTADEERRQPDLFLDGNVRQSTTPQHHNSRVQKITPHFSVTPAGGRAPNTYLQQLILRTAKSNEWRSDKTLRPSLLASRRETIYRTSQAASKGQDAEYAYVLTGEIASGIAYRRYPKYAPKI